MKFALLVVKDGAAIAFAFIAMLLPHEFVLAYAGYPTGYAYSTAGVLLLGAALWVLKTLHEKGMHASPFAHIIATATFIGVPVLAYWLGWLVWPHLVVSIFFLIQPPIIWWRTRNAARS